MFIHLIFVPVPKTNNLTFLSFQIAAQLVLLVSAVFVCFLYIYFEKIDM